MKSSSQELSKAVRSLARNLETIADLLDDGKSGIPALDAADKKGKKRKIRDPDMPKNPKSAYILFSMAKRDEVKKEIGGNVREVMTELARRWQSLSDKQKQPYLNEAAKEKKRHEKDMEEYRLKKSAEGNDDVATATLDAEENESSSEESASSESSEEGEEVPSKPVQKKVPAKATAKPVVKPAVKPAIKNKKPSSSSANHQPNKKAKKSKQ